VKPSIAGTCKSSSTRSIRVAIGHVDGLSSSRLGLDFGTPEHLENALGDNDFGGIVVDEEDIQGVLLELSVVVKT